jgi:uncharacterized protein YyaL (SSP411 family)
MVLDDLLNPSKEIAIVGRMDDPQSSTLRSVASKQFLPGSLVLPLDPSASVSSPPFHEFYAGLANSGRSGAAYVCENFACNLPVSTPEELGGILAAHSPPHHEGG